MTDAEREALASQEAAHAWRERAEKAEAEVARLTDVLRPFHDAAIDRASDAPEWNDRTTISICVKIGDLRRARAALRNEESG